MDCESRRAMSLAAVAREPRVDGDIRSQVLLEVDRPEDALPDEPASFCDSDRRDVVGGDPELDPLERDLL
jgi:hypothetical protein